jgi:hypothetical protein
MGACNRAALYAQRSRFWLNLPPGLIHHWALSGGLMQLTPTAVSRMIGTPQPRRVHLHGPQQ